MKVIWFANINLSSDTFEGYNGGGWIESMKECLLSLYPTVELAIVFQAESSSKVRSKIINGVTYYSIGIHRSLPQKFYGFFKSLEKRCMEIDEAYISVYVKVIDGFNPDIIHIWGTEKNYGLLCQVVSVPCIIHLQGILNPSFNAFLPPFVSVNNYLWCDGFKNVRDKYNEILAWRYFVKRERAIFENCKYFLGRTDWDKAVTSILSPKSSYFYCSEILRDEFLVSQKWIRPNHRLKLVSVISSPLYKGADLILKTAEILKNRLNLDFEWCVYGIKSLAFLQKKIGINCSDVNIFLCGVASANDIVNQMLDSHVYVHPSYIDNSPNSLCEAQFLGIPVVACNVGGISSLIINEESGLLVPANDPYSMASKILRLCDNSNNIAECISENEILVATERHNKVKVVDQLVSIYSHIINV